MFLQNNRNRNNKPLAAAAATVRSSHSQKASRQVVPKEENKEEIRFCHKVKSCGHKCMGCRGETACLPCLEPECKEAESRLPDK